MRKVYRLLFLLFFIAFALINNGCSLIDEATNSSTSAGISAEELSKYLAEAESSITETSDLSQTKTAYESILEKDPENSEANVGMAIIETQQGIEDVSTEIADISSSFSNLFPSSASKAMKTVAVMTKVSLNLMAYQVKARNMLFTINSSINRLQIAERNEKLQFMLTKMVLIRLNRSIKNAIGTDPGIPSSLARYNLDLGDIYLLDSILNLSKALLNVTTSYNFSQLESKINAGTAISSPSDIPPIPIFSDGANRLLVAKEAFILAIDKFLHAAEIIFARTDTENRLLNPTEADKNDFNTEIKPFLTSLKTACQTEATLTLPHDTGNPGPFKIAIGNVLSSPMADLRDYIPSFDANGNVVKPVTIGGLFPDGVPEPSTQQ